MRLTRWCLTVLAAGGVGGAAAAEAPGEGGGLRLGEPVAETQLRSQRGQADPFEKQASRIKEDAEVFGNRVQDSPSGMNAIHEDAVSDNHGITTVIQNTGHHVAIQEATNVNVSVTP